MKIRTWMQGKKFGAMAALVLREEGDVSSCIVLSGWTNSEIKMGYQQMPTSQLLPVYTPPGKSVMMYKMDAVGIHRNGTLTPMVFWRGQYPDGWDIRRWGTNFLGKCIKFKPKNKDVDDIPAWLFTQVPTGWEKGDKCKYQNPSKWSRLKPAPVEGWFTGGKYGGKYGDDESVSPIKRVLDVAVIMAKDLGQVLEEVKPDEG